MGHYGTLHILSYCREWGEGASYPKGRFAPPLGAYCPASTLYKGDPWYLSGHTPNICTDIGEENILIYVGGNVVTIHWEKKHLLGGVLPHGLTVWAKSPFFFIVL